jgi:hypothetical protein
VSLAVIAVVYVTSCAPVARRRPNSAAPALGAPSLRFSALAATADVQYLRNARAYIQDNLWTDGNEQFAVWVDERGNAFAGKRRLPAGDWTAVDLSTIPGDPLGLPTQPDEHNVYAIAVDASGYIHIAGNMHNGPLRYVRSRRPRDISAWAGARMVGRDESSVSYPAFVRRRDGKLLFFHRDGRSGDGDVLADVYDGRRWTRLAKVIDGRSTGESTYLSHIAVDRGGVLHMLFVWRSTSDPTTNNDLSYARSRDGGKTWERSDGTQTTPIIHTRAEIVADTPPTGSGLSSGGGLEVDDRGRPHGAVLLGARGSATIRHVWFDDRWHVEPVDLPGVRAVRPTVVTSGAAAFLVVPTRDDVRLVDITPGRSAPGRSARAPVLLAPVSVGGWETPFDTQALYRDGTLSVVVPRRGPGRTIGSATATMELSDAA